MATEADAANLSFVYLFIRRKKNAHKRENICLELFEIESKRMFNYLFRLYYSLCK